MKGRKIYRVVWFLGGAFATTWAHAVPISLTPNVVSLIGDSDVIAIGRIAELSVARTFGRPDSMRFAVERVLGNAISAVPTELSISLDPDAHAALGAVVGEHGILFARRSGLRGFVPTDPVFPILPTPRYSFTNASVNDPLQIVVSQLIQVLATSPERTSEFVPGKAEQTYAYATRALATAPFLESTISSLQELATGDLPLLTRMWAINCLLKLGNIKYLHLAVPQMSSPNSEIGVLTVDYFAQALESFPLAESSSAERFVEIIGPLAGSTEVSVRRAVASALSDSGLVTAVPTLAKALGDEDPDVRYFAVYGLAAITKLQPIPSAETFSRDESAYLAFWRGWNARSLPLSP